MDLRVFSETFGKQQRDSAYSDLMSQDYTFTTNCERSRKDESVKRYEAQGLEVAVHERAFHLDGHEDPSMVAILTRKKR